MRSKPREAEQGRRYNKSVMDVQQIITLFLVAGAFAFLGRYVWAKIRSQNGDCGGCGMCGKPSAKVGVRAAPQATPLVTLGGIGAGERLPVRPRKHAPDK